MFNMFPLFPQIFFAPEGDTPGSGGSDLNPGNSPEPKDTEPNTNDLQNSLHAAKRRESEATKKLEEATKRLQALEAAEQKRKEAEMSELEKAQTEIVGLKSQIEKLAPFKLQVEAREQAAAEKVEQESASLTDEQKAIMSDIGSNEAKLRYIDQIKSVAGRGPGIPPGGKPPQQNGDFISKEVFNANKANQKWLNENLDKVNASMSKW